MRKLKLSQASLSFSCILSSQRPAHSVFQSPVCAASGVVLWTPACPTESGVQLVSSEADAPFVTDALVDIHQSLVADVTLLPYKVRCFKDHAAFIISWTLW